MLIFTRLRERPLWPGILSHSLITGSSWTFFAKVLGTGITFGFHVMLSRILGPNAYGNYVYVIIWVNILALIGMCGFGTASMRFLAVYTEKKQWNLLKGFLRKSTLVSLSVSIGMMVVLGGVLWAFKATMSASLFRAFQFGLFLLPIFVYFNLSLAHLRGLRRAVIAELLFTSIRPVLIVSIILLFFHAMANSKPSAANTLLCESFVICALIWVALNARQKVMSPSIRSVPSAFRSREWLGVSFPMLLLAIFHMINSRADIVVIGFFWRSSDVAIYNAANKIATLASFGLIAINNVLAPTIAQLNDQEEKLKLQYNVKLSAWASVVLGAPIVSGIVLLKPYLFGLFGPSYLAGDIPLTILLLCQVINILAGPVGILLTMTTHHLAATKMMGISAIINLGLNFGLVPRFGITGAAVATGLSTLIWNVTMLILVVSKLKINPTIFRMPKPFGRRGDAFQ